MQIHEAWEGESGCEPHLSQSLYQCGLPPVAYLFLPSLGYLLLTLISTYMGQGEHLMKQDGSYVVWGWRAVHALH